jgi:hypothetical protein
VPLRGRVRIDGPALASASLASIVVLSRATREIIVIFILCLSFQLFVCFSLERSGTDPLHRKTLSLPQKDHRVGNFFVWTQNGVPPETGTKGKVGNGGYAGKDVIPVASASRRARLISKS